MTRKVFYSFHFANDFWRTQQVRNMGAIEGQKLCSANEWEEVKQNGADAIEKWIDDQLYGKSCLIVLVGAETASRPWVIKEIVKAWNGDRGVLAIRIHRLRDASGSESVAGQNPLSKVYLDGGARSLAEVAPIKNPSGSDSKAVYASIADNIEQWIEEAIRIRKEN